MKSAPAKNRNWMPAITFAEAGEWDIAREMIPASRPNSKISWLQKIFIAVTFAEAGLHQTALRFLDGHNVQLVQIGFLDAVGLNGVRVTYGLLPVEVSSS